MDKNLTFGQLKNNDYFILTEKCAQVGEAQLLHKREQGGTSAAFVVRADGDILRVTDARTEVLDTDAVMPVVVRVSEQPSLLL
ncbi:MAG TPA: hypothetical protein VF439_02175 [Candidatus Paceibacterota bacterium]